MKKIIATLVLILIPLISQAKIYILIDEAANRKFPIAVPEFVTSSGSASSQSQEYTSLLKKDLAIAGIFKVLDEASFVERDSDTDRINFSKWTAIEAHALVKGVVENKGGKVTLELRLYDTQTQQLLVGKQYSVSKKDYSQAIHRFVDEIMNSLTGAPGPFTAKVAAACGRVGNRQIRTFSIDGTNNVQATNGKANNISPNWSPDGSQLVFTSFLKYFPEIFSASSKGGGMRQLTASRSTSLTPAYSPDGNRIVYASSFTGDTELHQMTPAGKALGKITNVVNIDVSPAWSPDGSQIVFASERAGNLHLFVMPSGGGSASRLTYTGYQNDQPDWSPDGRRIVFTSRAQGAFDVFMMNADGSMIQRVTRDEGNNESPTWSPDSRYIAFSSARRGASGIYVMLEDGNNQTLIPNTAGCINPDWGPRVE